jgi:hypothetical protein
MLEARPCDHHGERAETALGAGACVRARRPGAAGPVEPRGDHRARHRCRCAIERRGTQSVRRAGSLGGRVGSGAAGHERAGAGAWTRQRNDTRDVPLDVHRSVVPDDRDAAHRGIRAAGPVGKPVRRRRRDLQRCTRRPARGRRFRRGRYRPCGHVRGRTGCHGPSGSGCGQRPCEPRGQCVSGRGRQLLRRKFGTAGRSPRQERAITPPTPTARPSTIECSAGSR